MDTDTIVGAGAGQDQAQLAPGTRIDHFKVMRLLGVGGMAQVYLARDTLLGRKVALKVIRPTALGSPESVSRFLFEARATALFSHPHIVTIFAVGEHLGRPYVALEFLEGQTLRERIEEAPPSVRDTVRIGLAIAEALAEAHRHQILHRDLKPENVIIPRDGRLRVVDFGLAKSVGADEAGEPTDPPSLETSLSEEELAQNATVELFVSNERGLRGTPQYMSPEQWTGGECTGATDVWALGLILYEMLAGRLPYRLSTAMALACQVCGPDPVPELAGVAGVPDEVSRLVTRCLAKDAAERPTAAVVVEQLGELIERRPSDLSSSRSPFRGLLPFSERHAEFFFGRDVEIAAFLERLREEPVMPIVGPSGAGKSSFVQAGVIPRLREQGRWIVLRLRPGAQPLRALAARLKLGEATVQERSGASFPPPASGDDLELEPGGAAPADEELAQKLLESPARLNLQLQRLAAQSQARILLFVDQLEELYSLTDDERVRRAFMTALCIAADDPQDPVRVIFTLRDDFLGRLAEGPEAREALSHVTVLRSPDASTLAEVLVKPLAVVGYGYDDPTLVPEMVAAVGGEGSCLPLLQFVTRTLWDRRDTERRLLLREVYDEVGGVAGALAHHADGVLEGLSPSQVELTRQILVALVTPGGTRRVTPRAELVANLGAEADELLGRLVQARLVSVRKALGEGSREAVIELAHESLIGKWARLSRWVEASREELATLAQVEQAAELWDRRGRRPEELWAGDALREAQRHLEKVWSRASDAARRFVEAGKVRDARHRRRRSIRRALWSAGLVAIACAALAVAAAFADQNRRLVDQEAQTREQAVMTRERWAEVEREGARSALDRESLLEARSRLRAALEVDDSTLGRALWWRASEEPLLWSARLPSANYDVAFAPDGTRLAVANQDKAIHIFDATTGLETRTLRGHQDQVFSLAYSPDGRSIASGTWSGVVRLWDVARGTAKTLGRYESEIARLAFSPDGSMIASSSTLGEVRIWDPRGSARPRVLTVRGSAVVDLQYSPDGASLATIDDFGELSIFAAPWTGEPRRIPVSWPRDLDYGADGSRMVVATGFGLRFVDLATGRSEDGGIRQDGQVETVELSPDGTRVAAAGIGGSLTLWDLERRERFATLQSRSEWITGVDFDRDGARLASVGTDGSIRVWDATKRMPWTAAGGHEQYVLVSAFSPDGAQVASGGADGAIRLWDVASGRVVRLLEGHEGGVASLSYSPDGRLLASGGQDQVIRVWNTATGDQAWMLAGDQGTITGVAFGHSKLVSSAADLRISIWDIATRSREAVLSGHEGLIQCVALSPDESTIATASADLTVRTWNVARKAPALVLTDHSGVVRSVDFSPDGKRLISAGEDGEIRSWSLPDGASTVLARQEGRAYSARFRPDGRQVVTAGSDGLARLLSLEGGETVTLEGHRAEVNFAAYSPDGRAVATASDDGTVRLWASDTGLPIWRCPILVPAGVAGTSSPVILTHRGWTELGAEAERPRPGRTGWERRLEEAARSASISRAGATLCVETFDDEVEVWDIASDRRLSASRLEGLSTVAALEDRCVSLAGRTARIHPRAGASRELIDAPVSAIDVDGAEGDAVFVATSGRVLLLSPEGAQLEAVATGTRGRSMARTAEHLAVAFENGSIELWSRHSGERTPHSFRATPSSAATSLVPGPRNTLIVGFANGLVGLWDVETGLDLWHAVLNGAVVHLDILDGELSIATDLGDVRSLDLSGFELEYCEMLRRIWRAVPTTWRGGAAVRTPTPRTHRCARGHGS